MIHLYVVLYPYWTPQNALSDKNFESAFYPSWLYIINAELFDTKINTLHPANKR